MRTLPREILRVLRHFEDAFSVRVWVSAQVLVVGAILAAGQRTVAAALRVLGLSTAADFQPSHRVLNRAVWSSRALRRILLLQAAAPRPRVRARWSPDGGGYGRHHRAPARRPDRRQPPRASTGIRCAPATGPWSRRKASGLRWVSMPWLASLPWAQRVWALPFLTVLAPSERDAQERGIRHKTLPDWGRQMIAQLRRWLPDRVLVVVADSRSAVLELLAAAARLPQPVTVVTRRHAAAAGCGVVRSGPTPDAGSAGAPAAEGCPPTSAGPAPDRSDHHVGDGSVTLPW